jgi:hypothetical protein
MTELVDPSPTGTDLEVKNGYVSADHRLKQCIFLIGSPVAIFGLTGFAIASSWLYEYDGVYIGYVGPVVLIITCFISTFHSVFVLPSLFAVFHASKQMRRRHNRKKTTDQMLYHQNPIHAGSTVLIQTETNENMNGITENNNNDTDGHNDST